MEKTEYYQGIRRYVAAKVNNPADVDELTQGVFLEFYKCKNRYDNLQNPEAYLFGIARNLIARHYQNKQKQPKTIPIDIIEKDYSVKKESDHADDLKKQTLKETLKKSLKQLPRKDYETIRLCLSGKHSMKENAQKAGISIEAYYKRYQRALKILGKISMDILREDSGNR